MVEEDGADGTIAVHFLLLVSSNYEGRMLFVAGVFFDF